MKTLQKVIIGVLAILGGSVSPPVALVQAQYTDETCPFTKEGMKKWKTLEERQVVAAQMRRHVVADSLKGNSLFKSYVPKYVSPNCASKSNNGTEGLSKGFLHKAIENGNYTIRDYLLQETQINVNQCSTRGNSLYLARKNRCITCEELLLAKGAYEDTCGCTWCD